MASIVPHLSNNQLAIETFVKAHLVHTPHKSHDVGRNVSSTVPPGGQLDVSKHLTCGQREDVRVVGVLRRDSKRGQSQVVVETYRTRQSIWVIIKEGSDLRGVT